MGIQVSEGTRRRPRPVAAWILGAMSAVHAAGAFVFAAGGRTPANELEGFVMGTSASVLLVGAVLSYGLARLRAQLNQAPPR